MGKRGQRERKPEPKLISRTALELFLEQSYERKQAFVRGRKARMKSELEVLLSTWRRRQKAENIRIVRNGKAQEFDA